MISDWLRLATNFSDTVGSYYVRPVLYVRRNPTVHHARGSLQPARVGVYSKRGANRSIKMREFTTRPTVDQFYKMYVHTNNDIVILVS